MKTTLQNLLRPQRAVFALLMTTMIAACSEPAPLPPATQTASDFYQAYLLAGASGVPTAAQRATLSATLSPALLQLLVDAEQAEARQTEPAPLLQGDLFSSLFEGATGVAVQACKEVAEAAACDVLLTYAPPGQEPAQWRDVLLLVRTEAGWRVDDIEYGGDWPFGNKGRLRANLQQLLQAEGR